MSVTKKKRKPIRGVLGDQTLEIRFVNKDKAFEEGFAGRARVDPIEMHAEIEIADNLRGRALINTFFHEAFHVLSESHGMKLKHVTVYTMASLMCQVLTSTGIMNEGELEKRLKDLGAL